MNIQITGHGITITPAMHQHIEESCSRLTDHFEAINKIKAVINKPDTHHHNFQVTIELHVTKATLFAKAEHEDFYKALDMVKHKIIRQLDKHHDILMDRHHHAKKHDDHLDLHNDHE